MDTKKQFVNIRWLALIALLCLVSCSVKLISNYDEVIDKGLTDFQKKTDLYLMQKQKTQPLAYNESFYLETFADLQSLKTRALSVANNSQTAAIIINLASQIQAIKTTDSSGDNNAVFYKIAQSTVDNDCGSALKLELAKKRGD